MIDASARRSVASASPTLPPDSAARLYSAVAPTYDDSYAAAGHRQVSDRLAWERVAALPRPRHAHVVDVGCGTGRWASRLLMSGCTVTGIESAPGMIAEIDRRRLGPGFTLIRQPMEEVVLPETCADLVLAMGSVQYVADPTAMLQRFSGWLRPGGWLCVYVDSLVSLLIELMRRGEDAQTFERLRTRRGLLCHDTEATSLKLYDRAGLEADFVAAGLVDVSCHGLAIGAAAIGRSGMNRSMVADEDAVMRRERLLSCDPVLADCGLHLFASGRKPGEVDIGGREAGEG